MSERGADRNTQGVAVEIGLIEAVRAGDTDLVNSLLDSGVDANIQDESLDARNSNALQAAVVEERLDLVKLLLDRGADVNAQAGEFSNALQVAARYENLDIVKLLLDQGADVNAQGGYFGNALQAAVFRGFLDIVKLLLDQGADVNAQGGGYGNALQAAACCGNPGIVKLLLDRGADVNAQGGPFGNALQAAAKGTRNATDLGKVNLLLERGADVTVQPNSVARESLLHIATGYRNLALLEALLNAGADLGTQDDSGQTPLHVAVDYDMFPIAKYLLDRGASPDIEDFGYTSPFQLAMRNENRDMVLLLYPKTIAGLSSISASDWRRISDRGPDCNIEMKIGESAEVLFEDEMPLEQYLYVLSHPPSLMTERISSREYEHFLHTHRNGKRIFILPNGSMLYPGQAIDVHCRWWCKVRENYWTVRIRTAPSPNAVRQRLGNDCYLECALCFTCYALPEDMEEWPKNVQLNGNPFGESESRQGIMWIMMIAQAPEDSSHPWKPVLQSRIFFSTSEYAEIPKMATDLLLPLVKKVQSIWEQNFERFQKRFGLMRARILRSSGTEPGIIQELLNDAQLLELFRENLTKQIHTLQKFRDMYQSESWRALHELPLDEVRKKMPELERAEIKLQMTAESFLRGLTESSQNMIQLEFNLTSIREAQRSTSTNKSMKRLSWITFIFLPLLFIASLFGMNVDILKNNPAFWWYFPFAAFTMLGTFLVWIIFKGNKSLEGSLENRFQWLFPQQNGEPDLELGSTVLREARRAKTSAFPAFGKKRS